jgi:hypothetical protein
MDKHEDQRRREAITEWWADMVMRRFIVLRRAEKRDG